MAAGDLMRLVWIDGVGCTPSPWPLTAKGALVSLSASASSWMCALSMAAAARVRQSPWPSCNPATRVASLCWNRGDLLKPAVVHATRSMPCRRKLHPAVKSVASNAVRCRELQACTSELRPAARGAARGEATFCGFVLVLPNQLCLCWNRCIFLLEPRYFFASMIAELL
uniref:Uncharacterized protein n=1 Tax=Triticum urartu TaxID=4572 RepID=A0A8R7U1L6_TRIUA